jgi:tetratricopeptide (TPR) repeat protein
LTIKIIFFAAAATALAACASTRSEPEAVAGDYLAARLAANVNDIRAAADKFAKAAGAQPEDPELVRQAFLFHLAAGRIAEAARYAEKVAPGEPPAGLARVTRALVKLKQGDLAAAHGLLAADFEEPFSKSMAFLTDAWIAAEAGGPRAGIAAFNAGKDVFLGFNPTFKAMLFEAAGDLDAARAAHAQSVASFGSPVGRAAYGAFLERHGERSETLDYYAALEKEGGPSQRLARAAVARIEAGAPSSAYTEVTAREGAALALFLLAGNVLQESAGEMQRAAEAGFKVSQTPFNLPLALAQLAAYLDPALSDAQTLIASINLYYGNGEAARAALSRIPPPSPQFEQAQIAVADSLAAEDRRREAVGALEAAIRSDPTLNEVRLRLATLLAELDRHDRSIKIATEAIDRLGDTPPADAWRFHLARAASLLDIHRYSEAEADLKRAVELAPDEPVALNYLGYTWAERGVHLEEAFKLIKKAAAMRPESGAIIDSLGWAHYQLGDYQSALPHLEKAAALEPADPTVTEHLGDVYWRLGRATEAKFQWRRALELKPSDSARDTLMRKLKSGLPADEESPKS